MRALRFSLGGAFTLAFGLAVGAAAGEAQMQGRLDRALVSLIGVSCAVVLFAAARWCR